MFRVVVVAVALALLVPASPTPVDADTGTVVATVTVAPDASLALSVSRGRLAAGIPFHVDAEFDGSLDSGATFRLHASPALLVRGGATRAASANSKHFRWALCSDRPDSYVVLASIEWPDGRRVESEAVVIGVAPSKKNTCPKPWLLWLPRFDGHDSKPQMRRGRRRARSRTPRESGSRASSAGADGCRRPLRTRTRRYGQLLWSAGTGGRPVPA